MEILPADGEVRIVWDKILSRILFQAGPVCLVTPLINETPRDYARAIPSSFTTTFDLAHHEVLQMLKAFVPFCRNSILKLCYHKSGVVKFEAESEEFDGECVLETDVSGQDGEMLLNMRLLANILNNVEAPSLTISVAGPTDPVLIVPTGRTDYVSVLMPMSRL
jgi:DNA polymerase III sliding clamp (beta) subunit (PCNA family)